VDIVTTPDGRSLEYRVDGPAEGPTIIFHHGTPGAPVDTSPVTDAAEAAGVRVVSYARPGYAGSSVHRGRRVADAADDAVTIADTVGVERFVCVGTSGGGPHALAVAALRPERCVAAAIVAGVAPHDANGLDWMAGMGADNLEEFGAAERGIDDLTAFLEQVRPQLIAVTADELVTAMGSMLPDVDRRALSGEFGEFMATTFHRAVSAGIDGWRDDDLAFVTPWGFELAGIVVPIAVWQGDADLMVPAGHGAWLAEQIPTAVPHLLPGEGHVSVLVNRLSEILTDVVALAPL
jgi:pimeloyl-ACP methyl ester carboxylesterase